MPEFSSLPTELKLHILQFLPRNDALEVRLVSQVWNTLVSEFAFHDLKLELLDHETQERYISCLPGLTQNCFNHVRSLHIIINSEADYSDKVLYQSDPDDRLAPTGYSASMDAWAECCPHEGDRHSVLKDLRLMTHALSFFTRLERLGFFLCSGHERHEGHYARNFFAMSEILERVPQLCSQSVPLRSLTIGDIVATDQSIDIRTSQLLDKPYFAHLKEPILGVSYNGDIRWPDSFSTYREWMDPGLFELLVPTILETLADRAPGLAHLVLESDIWFGFCPSCTKVYESSLFPKLKSLNLNKHVFCTQKQLDWLESLQMLEELTLNNCSVLLYAASDALRIDGYADLIRYESQSPDSYFAENIDTVSPTIRWANIYESIGKLPRLNRLQVPERPCVFWPGADPREDRYSGYIIYDQQDKFTAEKWKLTDNVWVNACLFEIAEDGNWARQELQSAGNRPDIMERDEKARKALRDLGVRVELWQDEEDSEQGEDHDDDEFLKALPMFPYLSL